MSQESGPTGRAQVLPVNTNGIPMTIMIIKITKVMRTIIIVKVTLLDDGQLAIGHDGDGHVGDGHYGDGHDGILTIMIIEIALMMNMT